MAVADKTGRMHHSASRARLADDMAAEKKPAMMPKKEPMGEKPEHEESPEDIHEVVAEHGPAHHVEYHHDEAAGKHHVHSKHGEAEHEHHAVHDTMEEAHAHMGHAMGQGEPDEDDEEVGEEAGEEMPAMEEQSEKIPGM